MLCAAHLDLHGALETNSISCDCLPDPSRTRISLIDADVRARSPIDDISNRVVLNIYTYHPTRQVTRNLTGVPTGLLSRFDLASVPGEKDITDFGRDF